MAKVNIKIEGFPYQVEDGITIMESSEFFYEDTEEGRAAAAKKKEND